MYGSYFNDNDGDHDHTYENVLHHNVRDDDAHGGGDHGDGHDRSHSFDAQKIHWIPL